MSKLYLAALLLAVSVLASAGKYSYPSTGNANSQAGSIPGESNVRVGGPQSVGGKAGNQGEDPISDQVIEEHRLGDTAAELDRERHEREAKCAAEAKQHKDDPDCD
ncbi:MAG TPA: hypothetical protein VLV32_12235 [Burkholderiales bacterium]|jgi:hypothetical protein|nr:hypothetical protein [Burkholderiales bacterium]